MIYEQDQDLRQLLDERARSYSPNRAWITSRVASGRAPHRPTASRGVVLAAAAVVFCAGFVWGLRSATGPEAISTVSDDGATSELDEPSPLVDPDADQIDPEELVVVGADETTTTSTADGSETADGSGTADGSETADGSGTNGEPTATPEPTTATPTTDGSGTDGEPTPTPEPTPATPTTTTTIISVASTLGTTTEVEQTTTTSGVVVDAPDSCYVQTDGIEVFDSAFEFAQSYTFLDEDGRFVLNTSSLGPADDIEDEERSIEWTVETYGYDHVEVYSVAAVEPQGGRSEPVVCRRHVLLD